MVGRPVRRPPRAYDTIYHLGLHRTYIIHHHVHAGKGTLARRRACAVPSAVSRVGQRSPGGRGQRERQTTRREGGAATVPGAVELHADLLLRNLAEIALLSGRERPSPRLIASCCLARPVLDPRLGRLRQCDIREPPARPRECTENVERTEIECPALSRACRTCVRSVAQSGGRRVLTTRFTIWGYIHHAHATPSLKNSMSADWATIGRLSPDY